MTGKPFSRRHNYTGAAKPITIREEAPEGLRSVVLETATDLGMSPSALRSVLCRILHKRPDQGNWSDYPNIWDEAQYLMYDAEWFKVYDIVEKIYEVLSSDRSRTPRERAAGRFADEVNSYFEEEGVGWKLEDGLIVTRGAEAFESVMSEAVTSLDVSGKKTATSHLHEAIAALSRRPEPNSSGAIYHAMGALECVARDLTGDEKATLGAILKSHGDLVPPPLDKALSQIWGFASEEARHVREGHNPTRDEAELVVGLAATICTYLVRKSA
jgi:hypothetical protein